MRETVASICSAFGPKYSREKHAEGKPPTELWDALAEKGYLGVNIPEQWGGGGLGMSALAAVGEEITASGSSLLLIVVSPAIVGSILARHGTPVQNDRWLRGIAAGTTKVAFAITEADAGTNSHNLSTSLERRGDRFVLRGQKTYISGVEHADAVLVVARSRMPDGTLGLPSLCLVDVDAPGFTREAIPMPYIGPGSAVDALLRRGGARRGAPHRRRGRRARAGVRRAQPGADHGGRHRVRGRTPCARQGQRVRQRARRVGQADRHPPGVSHPLAEAKIGLELARLMTQKAAALYDAGVPGAGEASNMAKFASAEAAIACVDRSIQAHGGNGFALEYELTDMWWGVRLHAHRAGVARDDPQLRGRALARATQELLTRRIG